MEPIREPSGSFVLWINAAANRHQEACVGNQPLQELLPSPLPQQSLGVPRHVSWSRIAADELPEKRVLA